MLNACCRQEPTKQWPSSAYPLSSKFINSLVGPRILPLRPSGCLSFFLSLAALTNRISLLFALLHLPLSRNQSPGYQKSPAWIPAQATFCQHVELPPDLVSVSYSTCTYTSGLVTSSRSSRVLSRPCPWLRDPRPAVWGIGISPLYRTVPASRLSVNRRNSSNAII